ncbi:MAG: oligopeptide/dipeptide ABC transporter ATP-binding protein [Armatimonadota bacterium]
MEKLIEVKNLKKYFAVRENIFKDSSTVKAVDNVSFDIYKGETLGLVGESGCGKSTLGRLILRLLDPTSGSVNYKGENILKYGGSKLKTLRENMQIVFQDPFASLNPRMSIMEILAEPVAIHKVTDVKNRKKYIEETLKLVGLPVSALGRYPHEFSGGQRQRISLARSLTLKPEFIVADEPVSALDVSIQAQIINLLKQIQGRLNLTYLFISHDLAVVKYISDRVIVMYLGKIVEKAASENIFTEALHPYTKALIAASPRPGAKKEKITLKEDILPGQEIGSGCRFAPRCAYSMDICAKEEPVLKQIKPDHFTACHLYNNKE